ncbi:hypothetical protein SUGI_0718260 [Cryptomeria japonica]|nr:hypothetical protein SUGI_0718260 [Cryptomeria japonica]
MRIEESGNPVLLNRSNGTMWQSFDHPTDLLISGQRLEISCDGHLRLFSYDSKTGRSDHDYLSEVTSALTRCDYPTVCGDYGICTDNQCSCPKTENYFYQIDTSNPSLGCSPVSIQSSPLFTDTQRK